MKIIDVYCTPQIEVPEAKDVAKIVINQVIEEVKDNVNKEFVSLLIDIVRTSHMLEMPNNLNYTKNNDSITIKFDLTSVISQELALDGFIEIYDEENKLIKSQEFEFERSGVTTTGITINDLSPNTTYYYIAGVYYQINNTLYQIHDYDRKRKCYNFKKLETCYYHQDNLVNI